MPPNPILRPVTMEQLFADAIDLQIFRHWESYRVALQITMEFLSTTGYIQFLFGRQMSYLYPNLYSFVVVIAHSQRPELEGTVINNVPFLNPEQYEEDVKNVFRATYEQYPIDISYLMICVVAMTICRHIQIHRIHRWYMRHTVMLLARAFCGDRFENDTSFDWLETLFTTSLEDIAEALLRITPQTEIPPRFYLSDRTFEDELLGTNPPLP